MIRQAVDVYDEEVLFDEKALFRELTNDMSFSDMQEVWSNLSKAWHKLKKRHVRKPVMLDIDHGVIEELPSGRYDIAFQTNREPMRFLNVERTNRVAANPRWSGADTEQPQHTGVSSGPVAAGELVTRFAAAGNNVPTQLLCAIELARFTPAERDRLLPLLWRYILDHRDSNSCKVLVGVAAAIRKYIAIMPMERMGELATLLETGHRSPLSVDLEIEVAKMIYRDFEVHPPVETDPYPDLAQRLLEMVEAYVNPRILLRNKYSAAASLAIEAIVAMRSSLAETAWKKAETCRYRWFAELVSDEIDELQEKWHDKNAGAAGWLQELRNNVLTGV